MTKIGWLLTGGLDVASSRIMGWNVHQYFVDHPEMGVTSEVIYYRKLRGIWSLNNLHLNVSLEQIVDLMKGFDVAIFQKICMDNSLPALLEAKKMGIKTVYLFDDLFRQAIPMAENADIAVVGSMYIKWALKLLGVNSFVINDAYETPRDYHKTDYSNDPPKVVWFGTVANLQKALQIKWMVPYPYDIISADMPGVTIKWNRFTVWDDIIKRDIVVIPNLKMYDEDKAKGNNRLTQSMVLGMPTIVSPIPAYTSIIQNGVNGFIAYKDSEWVEYLKALKDQKLREKMGTRARTDVIDEYSQESICMEWLRILNVSSEVRCAE